MKFKKSLNEACHAYLASFFFLSLFFCPNLRADGDFKPIVIQGDDLLVAEARRIAETYRLIDIGKIRERELTQTIREKSTQPIFSQDYLFLDAFFELTFKSNSTSLIEICNHDFSSSLERSIIQISCKLKALTLLTQSPTASELSAIKSVFKSALRPHETIAVAKWLTKNPHAVNKASLALKEFTDHNDIAPLPEKILSIFAGISKKEQKIHVNQLRFAQEEFRGIVDRVESSCLNKENYAHLLPALKKNYEFLQTNTDDDFKEEITLDALTLTRYTQGRGCLDVSALVLSLTPLVTQSESLDDLYFRNLWQFITQKKYKEAQDYIQTHKIFVRDVVFGTKIQFWSSIIYEKNGQKDLAQALLLQLIRENPLDFYSILASKRLLGIDHNKGNFHQKMFSTPDRYTDLNSFIPKKSLLYSLTRLELWSKVPSPRLMANEIDNISIGQPAQLFENPTANDPLRSKKIVNSLILNIAMILSQNSQDLEAFKFINKAIIELNYQPSTKTLEVMFPLKFKDLIWGESIKNDLDPFFTLSLIRQESAFNTMATSPVGARGLMQVMPMTARILQRGFARNDLYRPEKNIILGTRLLKKLSDKFGKNLVFVLAAYNAGDRRVTQWSKEIFKNDEDFLSTIESVPFLETNAYIKLIYRNIYFYKMLLSGKDDVPHLATIFDLDLGITNKTDG